MIDAEVSRLRRLRDVALGVRSLARAIQLRVPTYHAVCECSAVLCWRIASIASGRLQAHPYRSFQRGPSPIRTLAQDLAASVASEVAHRRGMAAGQLLAKLQRVARELDDVRTLTWSADLGDSLGRAQTHLRNLLQRVEFQALQDAGGIPVVEGPAALDLIADSQRPADGDSWPYLTI